MTGWAHYFILGQVSPARDPVEVFSMMSGSDLAAVPFATCPRPTQGRAAAATSPTRSGNFRYGTAVT